MGDILEDAAKQGLELGFSAGKGFLALLGIGVGALVVRFGAEVVLDVIGAGVEVIKVAIGA